MLTLKTLTLVFVVVLREVAPNLNVYKRISMHNWERKLGKMNIVFTRLSAGALFNFLMFRMQCLLRGGVYLRAALLFSFKKS